MNDSKETKKSVPPIAWIIAYAISPALGFVCLRVARAIGIWQCILGVFASLIVQLGIVSVLGQTNDDPLQIFIVYLLGFALYAVLSWQYMAGQSAGIWSQRTRRWWRIAVYSFGVLMGISMPMAIVLFHLARIANKY